MHRGSPRSCGKQCSATRRMYGQHWEDENILGGALLKRTTTVDEEMYLDRSPERG